jgi:copper chaperone
MTKIYRVSGMTCDGCARAVESAIRAADPAVDRVSVDLAKGTVTVGGSTATDQLIAEAVDDAGFDFAGRA